ncbi:HAD-IC family P-type ATPase [Phaeacidiphilus oryzae]|uniref:HAD-IC family P-type ATPase n=1 Tax=Phaeacidiphilus oryzae TaxID=348818 RepID=UPI00068DE13C|nr:HAD-IC family P-type ATPase [Phaeacidiphilus oryzae]
MEATSDEPSAPTAGPEATGLSAQDVADRVARGQVNDVPARSSRSLGEILRANILTRFNAIIGFLFVVILIVGPIQDGLFGFIIVANTGIGIVQELRAKRTLDSLAVIGEARPRVRRDGRTQEVPTGRLVLGDLIELSPGDKVPVDGDTVWADGLEVDESLLTGEADPVLKRPGAPVLSGSFVVAGAGLFTATRVGREAYAAQLAEEASRFTLVRSELRSGIDAILRYITWVLVPVGIGLVLSQFYVDRSDLPEAIRRMVAGIVPMVPEGLVLLTSMAFAIGVVRLGRRQCLVQELPAIEGLARVDTVCLDKTGTLTEGGMDLSEVRPLGTGADLTGPRIREVLGELGVAEPRPNPSLRAIAEACPAPEGWRVLADAPFSSARKWSGARLAAPDGAESTWLLGAPDVLLPAGHPILGEVDELGAQGLRVLLLGRTDRPLDAPEPAAGLRPAALVVLRQRMRPDAGDTLEYFRRQEVAAKVISGDNAVSVGAVARALGLPGAESPVDARRLPAERAEMAPTVDGHSVFGRVTPQQKREMVGALQLRGRHVAMTGDGVNDVLALKDADIGVAMGSGSEATRAVAQIVLLDDRFATLPDVVAEGRRVIGNITRVANLFLVKTVYSVLLAVLVAGFRVPYPFLPRHSTVLSGLTIGIPGFFLALAPNTERARPGFVRRVLRFAVPCGLIAGAATFASYLLARADHRTGRVADTSVATLVLFLLALWVLVIIARPYTWWRVLLVVGMAVLFGLVLVVPPAKDFFQLDLEGWRDPWEGVAIAAAGCAAMEFAWRAVARLGERRDAERARRDGRRSSSEDGSRDASRETERETGHEVEREGRRDG